MFKFLNWSLTWWNGSTLGTWIYTKRNGTFVGEDLFGNTYYQTRDGVRRTTRTQEHAVPAPGYGSASILLFFCPRRLSFVAFRALGESRPMSLPIGWP